MVDRQDRFLSGHTQNGEFSMKSAYNLLIKEVADMTCWIKVWNSQLIAKVNFFWWSLIHGKILTLDNLAKRGLNLANICCLCKTKEKSINHLLLHCELSKEVWHLITHRLNITCVFNLDVQQLADDWLNSS